MQTAIGFSVANTSDLAGLAVRTRKPTETGYRITSLPSGQMEMYQFIGTGITSHEAFPFLSILSCTKTLHPKCCIVLGSPFASSSYIPHVFDHRTGKILLQKSFHLLIKSSFQLFFWQPFIFCTDEACPFRKIQALIIAEIALMQAFKKCILVCARSLG